MDFWILKFAAILVFAERISSLPLACSYNGTSHGEGETVRTEEPCLFCTCQRGTLECSLRVCADHPDVLPTGCFFLHRPNECCPQLFCEEDGNLSPTGVELRTDYKLDNKVNRNDCSINGSIFAEGSALASSLPCEYCYCVEGEIKCVKPRCLQPFEGCKAVYERSSCCPTHYDCRNADVNLVTTQIEKFVLASRTDDETLTTFSDFVSETEETNSEEESFQTEGEEESGTTTTTTEEDVVEKTTTTEKEEATTPVDMGFQTTSTEFFKEGRTEGTSSAPESSTPTEEENLEPSTVRVQGKSDFSETSETTAASPQEIRNESSQAAEDYDYGEPRLPPSLPNLVIFPFVAADAIVKHDDDDDDAGVVIKRVDSHPDFYTDFFSPPVKTEGGFVPKESFYDRDYFKEDQMESPDADTTATAEHEFIGDRWASVTGIAADLKNAKPSEHEESAKQDSPTLQKSQKTKKPVTVTYKHVVVDFYPKYLITTTRARPKIQSGENWPGEVRPTAGGGLRDPSQNAIAISNVFGFVREIISPTPGERTGETPTTESITETTVSFFHEFLNSFLSEETTPTTAATTTTTSAKPKYSAKIKSNGLKQDEKSTTDRISTTDSSPLSNALGKPEGFTKPPFFNAQTEFGSSRRDENLVAESTEPPGSDVSVADGGAEVGGGILKLAGCNIYGMMYRVGKVIAELSGPCLECLCTELGVQCRPLKC